MRQGVGNARCGVAPAGLCKHTHATQSRQLLQAEIHIVPVGDHINVGLRHNVAMRR